MDNCYYQSISKDSEGNTDLKEKWYGTDYKQEEIEQKTLNEWRDCNTNDNDKLWPLWRINILLMISVFVVIRLRRK